MVALARRVYTACTNGEPLILAQQNIDGMKWLTPHSTWQHRLPPRERALTAPRGGASQRPAWHRRTLRGKAKFATWVRGATSRAPDRRDRPCARGSSSGLRSWRRSTMSSASDRPRVEARPGAPAGRHPRCAPARWDGIRAAPTPTRHGVADCASLNDPGIGMLRAISRRFDGWASANVASAAVAPPSHRWDPRGSTSLMRQRVPPRHLASRNRRMIAHLARAGGNSHHS